MNTAVVLADTSMHDVMELMFERYLIIGGVALLAILFLGVVVLMLKKQS